MKKIYILILLLIFACNAYSIDSIFEKLDKEESKSSSANKADLVGDIFDYVDLSANKEFKKAKIIFINKITAESKILDLEVDKKIIYGNAEILVKKCIKDKNDLSESVKILLEVCENRFGEEPKIIFRGWLFSDKPSISTVEHPVYQIFAKNCDI